MSEDRILDYWESQGATHGESHWASWGDSWMIELEIAAIASHINDGDAVLDIGCANGYSTFRQAELHDLASITGVDFASSMIAAAQSATGKRHKEESLVFMEGDVRLLSFPANTFDVVYTTRVLINLPTWEEQMVGIAECLRVAKPGGKVVLSEGFWEPLVLLNAMRALKQLEPLVEHDFNRYLKMTRLRAHLESLGFRYEVDDFSSIYYLGTRFLRDLVTEPGTETDYSNPINEAFFGLENQFSGGGFGIQQVVVVHLP